jgi:O-antigen/teichoic acid export membrane protein
VGESSSRELTGSDPAAPDASEEVGERAARNTAVRAFGEIVGKLATLVLFGVMTRKLGQGDVGVFVFASSFLLVALMPVDLGLDNWLVREIARDRAALGRAFWDMIALKCVIAVPVLAISFALVPLLGYDSKTCVTVYVLSIGFFVDAIARTVWSVFMGLERSELIAIYVIVSRMLAAALGIIALALGYGVVSVALTYSIAAVVGLVVALMLLIRRVGMPKFAIDRSRWKPMTAVSLPFAAQDVMLSLLFRLDAVILSLMATDAAVGRYGAAYRLFESTMFLTFAFNGAFLPMFAYLQRDSEPSLGAVFSRSVKFGVGLLMPCSVAFLTLATPLSRLFFGSDFVDAAAPLRILAPAVVLLGLVMLTSSLLLSRTNPRRVATVTGVMVFVNIALNVILIPSYDDRGSAWAMLVTVTLFVLVNMPLAAREVGGYSLTRMLAGPVAGGLAMAGVCVLLDDYLIPAVAAGLIAYALVFALVERFVAPSDFEFVRAMIGRRLPSVAR